MKIIILLLLLSCGKNIITNPFPALFTKNKNVKQKEVDKVSTTQELRESKEKNKEAIEKKKSKIKTPKIQHTLAINKMCKKIDKEFHRYGWRKSKCLNHSWHHVRNSVKGDPLMWVTFGSEHLHNTSDLNMTILLCGVHGDEITPIKFCFDILNYLNKIHKEKSYQEKFKKSLIVLAPIANPDSFFKRRPTRTNARGVDINRNLPTRDWWKKARKVWKRRYRKDKRRDPGKFPLSEPETLFQVNLIKRYKPTKIISVHAPLTIIDYDGPTSKSKNFKDIAYYARNLLIQMSKNAKDYRIKDYPFFTGSLGNYAGNERNIPTYTLELPSSDNRNHKKYWKMFKKSIDHALLDSIRIKTKVKVKVKKKEVKKQRVQKKNNKKMTSRLDHKLFKMIEF